MNRSKNVIELIVCDLIPDEPYLPPERRSEVESQASAFVVAQIARMPTYLRVPYKILIYLFNWMAVRQYSRTFVRLDRVKRRDYLGVWIHSTVGFKKDFIKLIRSCALLRFFDHPYVAEAMKASD